MAKITAVIDIGSNSCRMVVFEKTSRYAFNLVDEVKSRVVVSEGSFESKELQEEAMARTIGALKDFSIVAKKLGASKVLCVATSAVRDARNKNHFLKAVYAETKIQIKVINGEEESRLGAIATSNLIHSPHFITIDIGGGSTELSLVKNGQIFDSISLNIGTVRLKEQYSDKEKTLEEASAEINRILNSIPEHFKSDNIVGIGGTLRAFAKLIMQENNYPLNSIHGFEYSPKIAMGKLFLMASAKKTDLKKFGIKKERFETFREGALIYLQLLKKLDPKNIITSGVGVREGVYLRDLLRNKNASFPQNFDLSVRSLSDRFIHNESVANFNRMTSLKIFELLKSKFGLAEKYAKYLAIATKLHSVGSVVNFYNKDENSFMFLVNGLTFGFSHEERTLIAMIAQYVPNKRSSDYLLRKYKIILPEDEVVFSLSYILNLSIALNSNYANPNNEFFFENGVITIRTNSFSYINKENLAKQEHPKIKAIVYEASHR